jgi:hypothetical protein
MAWRLSEAERKRLPPYPAPCFRMGRLACRSDQQGRGLGNFGFKALLDAKLALYLTLGR